ncbi:MAG: acyl-CoA dehydrogenase family protein [Phycisphaerales bacterium]|nr:acyl-CoA dehydrogenase family protein [Phycisphaerales bacterium]
MKSLYFTEEHEAFRSSLRDFIKKELQPNFAKWEKTADLGRAVWKKMGDAGYLGLDFSEEYGGMGADFFYSVVFLEEMGRMGCSGVAAGFATSQFLACQHIYKVGSDALKKKYITPAIKGDYIGALAITEPNAGSDVAAIKTAAVRQGDFFIVNGTKTFITNGYHADFVEVAVKTQKGFSILVVDTKSEGFSANKLEKLGLHSSDTAELFLHDVKVPVSNLIGEDGMGFYYLMGGLQIERLVLAVMSLGIMDYALSITLQYLQERSAFGKPISQIQVLRHKIADLATEVSVAREFVYATCWKYANKQDVVKEASMAKLKTSEVLKHLVDECLQMFGGYGFMEEYPIARLYRDVRVIPIFAGTSEIMKEIIAKMIIDNQSFKKAY